MTSAARETAPALIALLMGRPRTRSELMRDSGYSRATVNRWLMSFELAGVVIGECAPGTNPASSPKLWRLNLRGRT